MRIFDVRFGGRGKEEVKGHREIGKVGPEHILLSLGNVLLESVMKYNPVLGHTHLQENSAVEYTMKNVRM